jgi:phenylacetate-CoA ligase
VTSETGTERFHRLLYLGVQRLRGRRVGEYLRQLLEWERLPAEAFHRLRAERLAGTLEYARSRVPFYGSARWREALERGDPRELRSWPVLDRETIKAHLSDLIARPIPPDHYIRRTSGSTGTPLGIAMDRDSASWGWATDYRGLLWHGIAVGARCLRLTHKREGGVAEWIRNWRALHTQDMSAPVLKAAVRYMQTARPVYVSGHVSAVTELARFARQAASNGASPLVPYAKVLGEALHPFQRQEIEQGLGAQVIGTYGCNETGTVAYECPAGSLHIFAEHVEVEILRDGQPVRAGEVGDIALTCTTNRAMPLVRYMVGDRGRLSPDSCACGRPHPVIAEVEGRTGDVLLSADGVPVHGAALGELLKEISAKAPTALGRVLFEQHDPRTWTVLVQAGPDFGDTVADLLVEGVKGIYGQACEVAVRQVPEIPREPSGKLRFYRRRVADAKSPPASPEGFR